MKAKMKRAAVVTGIHDGITGDATARDAGVAIGPDSDPREVAP